MNDAVFVIEGSSYSSGKQFPLTRVLKPIVLKKNKAPQIFYFSPFRFSRTCRYIEHITSDIGPMDKLTVFCKSSGAYKFFRDYHLLKLSLALAVHVSIVSIDPYYPFWKCGIDHPIYHDDTQPHNVRLWNLYQRTRYPMGALVHAEKPWIWSNTEITATHKTIISRPESIEIYKAALDWGNNA